MEQTNTRSNELARQQSRIRTELLSIFILLAVPILVITIVSPFGPLFWLCALLGFIPSTFYSKYHYHTWLEYVKARVRATQSHKLAKQFFYSILVMLFVAIVTLSSEFLGRAIIEVSAGLLLGLVMGAVAWPIWLSQRKKDA